MLVRLILSKSARWESQPSNTSVSVLRQDEKQVILFSYIETHNKQTKNTRKSNVYIYSVVANCYRGKFCWNESRVGHFHLQWQLFLLVFLSHLDRYKRVRVCISPNQHQLHNEKNVCRFVSAVCARFRSIFKRENSVPSHSHK